MRKMTNESLGAVHTGSLKENKKKNIKGITLVALVVTIIILLILAGISISVLTKTGLFEKAKQAEQKSKDAQELENETLGKYEDEIGKYVSSTRNEESTLLSSTEISNNYIGARKITLNIDLKSNNINNIAAYVVFNNKDNKIVRVTDNITNQIEINNLEQNTEYGLTVKLLDKYGRFSKSSNTVNIKTISGEYLYQEGVENKSIDAASGGYQGTLEKKDKYLFGNMNNNSNSYTNLCWWHFKDKIDLTNISKVYIEFYDIIMDNSSTSIFINAFSNINDKTTFGYATDCYAVDSYTSNSSDSNTEKKLTLDVSGLTGEYYIGFGGVSVPNYKGYGYDNKYTGSVSYKIKSIFYEYN